MPSMPPMPVPVNAFPMTQPTYTYVPTATGPAYVMQPSGPMVSTVPMSAVPTTVPPAQAAVHQVEAVARNKTGSAYTCATTSAVVAGRAVSVIVDTGSGVTIMGAEYFRSVGGNLDRVLPITFRYHAANGQRLNVLGLYNTSIAIGNTSGMHSFLVVEDLKNTVLLGNDLLADWKAVVIPYDNVIVLNGECIPMQVT